MFQSYVKNWLGMVFLASSDQFIITGFSIVLLIPLTYSIFKREIASRMYTVPPYFLASIASNVCANIVYPILVSTLTFWFFKFPINDFGGFMCYLLVMSTGALMGICFGMLIGSFVHSEYAALTWLMQTLSIYYLGSGVLVNAADANWLGVIFLWISPLRNTNELLMRRMLEGRPDQIQEAVLEQLGFDWGIGLSAVLCMTYMLLSLSLGLFLMTYLSRGT